MRQQLPVDDQVQILELENRALRFQVERQAQLIKNIQEENVLLKRFRALVARAGEMAQDLPALAEKIAARSR